MAYAAPRQPLLSWREACQLYLHDPHAHRLLRHIGIRLIPALAVVDAVDDFTIPFIGWADDLFWPILIVLLLQMLLKINSYRHQVPARTIIDQ